jgi:hypothetical protein
MALRGQASVKKDRRNLLSCLREIFDASFWKKTHQKFAEFEMDRTRWTLPMCMYAGLQMALDSAASESERFEKVYDCLAGLFPKRRRCGATLSGYHQALAALPLEFFDSVRSGLQAVAERYGLHLAKVGRWEVYGIDGSKENLPRTQEHEEHYGIVTKGPGAAERLVVAAVTLRRYVLWDWASTNGLGSERALALDLIQRLPLGALAVLDAGFMGYEWGMAAQASGRHFLVRVGGNVKFWVDSLPSAEWREDQVWLWPDRKRQGAPLVLRLIKIELPCRSKRGKCQEMYLVTDVLESERLTREEAATFYRKRWPANECTFRTWKKTLAAEKLASRTPIMAEPESEFSLCALMLLQVSICMARRKQQRDRRRISVARARRVWCQALRALAQGRQTNQFHAMLSECVGDNYRRRKPKVRCKWPARKEHSSIKTPLFRKLGKHLKDLGLLRLEEQKRATA